MELMNGPGRHFDISGATKRALLAELTIPFPFSRIMMTFSFFNRNEWGDLTSDSQEWWFVVIVRHKLKPSLSFIKHSSLVDNRAMVISAIKYSSRQLLVGQPCKLVKICINNLFCSAWLPLASARWVWSTGSSHCPFYFKKHHWLTSATSTILYWALGIGFIHRSKQLFWCLPMDIFFKIILWNICSIYIFCYICTY